MSGRIVLCEGYTSSFRLGFASGAAGVIFTSTSPLVVADVFALPTLHINLNDGQSVYNYLKSTRYRTFHQKIIKASPLLVFGVVAQVVFRLVY